MKKKSLPLTLGLGLLLAPSLGHAIPKSETSQLPIEPGMGEDPVVMEKLKSISNLTIRADTDDPNHYYYEPPFHAIPGGRAATVNVNAAQIKRIEKIEATADELVGPIFQRYKVLQRQYTAIVSKLATTADRQMQEHLKEISVEVSKVLSDTRKEIDDYQEKYQGTLPSSFSRELKEKMIFTIASAGGSVDKNMANQPEKLGKAIAEINRSNGGVFTANVLAGFTPEELDAIKMYLSERSRLKLPPIKLAKLPVENIEWGSLTELSAGMDGSSNAVGIPLIRDIKGGGTYQGATINLDLTLDGARSFQVAPPPMNLPVFAKGKVLQKYPGFEASLKCDFTTGWSVKGRADVRDGLVIFNDDVVNKMVASDENSTNEPCTLKIEKGSDSARQIAQIRALEAMKERLSKMFMERTQLAREDKEKYFQKVMADVDHHRHQGWGGGGLLSGVFSFASGGSGFMDFFTNSSKFYWHTNIQDIKNVSKLKWEERIVDNGNTAVTVDIATSICLAYNPNKQMYVACSIEERENADTLTKAHDVAMNSPECAGETSSEECGKIREQEAPRNASTGNIAPDVFTQN